ncbi:hypothetical protein FRB99_004301 [Tulasnella sp. 403]|nr:hypothetical protein FRB99_004301 [Tulasnella sp. 403]
MQDQENIMMSGWIGGSLICELTCARVLQMNTFGLPLQDAVRSWSEAPDCYAESILGDPEDGMRGEKRKLDRLVELEDEQKMEVGAKDEIVEDSGGGVDVLGPRPFKRRRL